MVFSGKLTNAKLAMKLPALIETGSLLKYVYKFSMPELTDTYSEIPCSYRA
jgi:hypothetical protein